MTQAQDKTRSFDLLETTIADIHAAYRSGALTARDLVRAYLDRIEAFDQSGPAINSIITINPSALEDAQRLDEAFAKSGPVGPMHGIPVILKDQIDAAGMATTLGSVLFKDYCPDRDAFVVEKLRAAGAILLAKATLGELGAGDTHGSLFGSTRNPYDLERTVGGSSGGPAAAIAANFGAVAVGQEALASIRRPAAWNGVVGMRPTAGLVSRSGVYAGWPATAAVLGPITRSVADQAVVLDALVGYDPEDPITALGVGHIPVTYAAFLDPDGLKGARIGVLRESIGNASEPDSADFAKVNAVFDAAVGELPKAGAIVVDPVVIPKLTELLAKRGLGAGGAGNEEAFDIYFRRSAKAPFASRQEMLDSPQYGEIFNRRGPARPRTGGNEEYLAAREELMINLHKVMADHQLDAIVHKSVEHQPTLIRDGVNPPYVNQKGATSINTFLVYVSSISVLAGFTTDNLPVGISLLGRAYSEGMLLKLAYAYEQATRHRKPPATTPAL